MRPGDRMRERLGAEKPPDRERERALNRGVWPAGAALVWVVVSLLGMLALFHPAFPAWLLCGTDPRALLTGHLRCCQAIALGMGVFLGGGGGCVFLQLAWVVRHIAAVFRERKRVERMDLLSQERMRQQGQEAVHAMASVILLCGAAMSICFTVCFGYIAAQEGIWTSPAQARADLQQLEADTLEEAEVWFAPDSRPASLPGPYEAEDSPVLLLHAMGADTGYAWRRLYLPRETPLSPGPERPFDETQPLDWNQEHAQRYQVRYTTNLHLAVEITPVR